jgi:hypothetical protein
VQQFAFHTSVGREVIALKLNITTFRDPRQGITNGGNAPTVAKSGLTYKKIGWHPLKKSRGNYLEMEILKG